jgi:ParB/RepB/Spo0J family partition protein
VSAIREAQEKRRSAATGAAKTVLEGSMTTTATANVPAIDLVDIDSIRPNPRQPRKQVGDITSLVESIRQVGLLEAITVFPADDDQGGYFLRFGHRRLAACREAGLTKIPAVIRATAESPGRQIVVLLTENRERDPLTPVEEADAIQELLKLGEVEFKTPKKVAEALGMSAATVKGRVALTRLPDEVKDRLHSRQITLAAAEAMVEFADDPVAIQRLNEAAGSNNWDWKLREERQRRKAAKARADLVAKLEKDGVKIIQKPEDQLRATEKPVSWCYADQGARKRVDDEGHAETCSYHAVVIQVAYDGSPSAVAYCTDPIAAGHHLPPYATATAAGRPVGGQVRPVDREREEQEGRQAIARGLRADFTAGVNLRDMQASLQTLRLLCRFYIPRFLEMQNQTFSSWQLSVFDIEDLGRAFGITIPKATYQGRPGTKAQAARDLAAARESWPLFEDAIASATADQVLHALLSIVRFHLEDVLRHPYSDRRKEGPAFLSLLDAWGYQPSDAEQQLRRETQHEIAEAEAEEEGWDEGDGEEHDEGEEEACAAEMVQRMRGGAGPEPAEVTIDA